jgi:hypothetical protein
MWWLTKPRVNAIPIVTSGGEVIIRATPEAGDAWIHPGFMRYSFIERGVKKGKERFVEEVLAEAVEDIFTVQELLVLAVMVQQEL